MSKKRSNSRSIRNNQTNQKIQSHLDMQYTVYQDVVEHQIKTQLKKYSPQNKKQKEFQNIIRANQIIFCYGPAGTSKSYTSTCMAIEGLLNKEIDKLVITRPVQSACGEELGFLKGDLAEKYSVYLEPFIDIFHSMMGVSHTENLIRNKKIEAKPLAFLRGKSFSLFGNCWILVDECQGYSPEQFLLLLTRIGENTKIIFTGDIKQRDNFKKESGLLDAIRRLKNVDSVGVMEFTKDDIVRAGIIKEIIEAYE